MYWISCLQPPPVGRIHRAHVAPVEAHRAAGRLDELLQGAADGGFAAAGFPHQRQRLAGIDVEADFLHRVDAVGHAAEERLAHVEAGGQPVDLEDRLGVIGRVLHMRFRRPPLARRPR